MSNDSVAPRARGVMNWSVQLWDRVIRNPSAMIIGNTGAQSVLRMVSNVALARLLLPSAFGLMALTTLILTGITMVSDVGIAITALREGDMSRDDEDRLWTMQMVRGVGVSVAMLAAAAPVGWLYGDTRLRDVLFALALAPLLQSLASLYPTLALGQRRLLPSTLLELVGRVGGMVLSVGMAFITPTVWALVIGSLVGTAVQSLGGHLMARRWPRLIIDFPYMARQWRFSRWIQASSTLTFAGAQGDKALFPFLFGLPALGLYGIGSNFAAIPAQVTQRWSASVYYPLAVQFLTGGAEPRRRLLAVRTTMLLYTAVLVLALAAVAPAFFGLLYARQYQGAALFAQILALGVFFDTAESSLRHFPLVEDTPRYEVWVVLVRLAAFAIGVAVVYAIGAGATGFAFAYVLGLAVGHLYMLAVCVRRGYLRPRLDLLMTAALVVAVVAIDRLPVASGIGPLIAWGAAIGVAGTAALFAVFRWRGLPSLSAEPAPELLRETAEEERHLSTERA
ncbi:oligosaccharide flippase family protein [Sphingomonas bacterium]|uniref:oligosaccharide flippase family protein n=1 Tax=Sphingomonas bacterium TaxID=1895847 RepID=UPI0015767BE6|nr:oligosaccharide flippase family protein [Sphingomonas bacterium]